MRVAATADAGTVLPDATRPPAFGGRAARAIHYVMLCPAQLLLAAFLVLPALYVGWLSFTTATYGQDVRFVGLANYVELFGDRVFRRAFLNTFLLVNGIVVAEILLGLGLAVLVSGPMRFKPLVIAMLLAPYAITESSAIVMWRYMLEPDVGMLSHFLVRLGVGELEWTTNPVATLFLAGTIAVWHHLPFTFLILYAALTTVPAEIREAAQMDGASRGQQFWYVTLRVIMPAILIAILFRYIYAIRTFAEVWLLTEGGPARLSEVLAIYLYREMFRYHQFGMASATGWIMLLMSLAIAYPYLRRMYREVMRGA